MNKIVIITSGGVIDSILSNEEVEVVIYDYDELKDLAFAKETKHKFNQEIGKFSESMIEIFPESAAYNDNE